MHATLALVALLGTAGCDGTIYQPYRYKETLVVETPQGIRTGSTVIEVRMYKEGQSNPFARGGIHGEFEGEAAEVDLPMAGRCSRCLPARRIMVGQRGHTKCWRN